MAEPDGAQAPDRQFLDFERARSRTVPAMTTVDLPSTTTPPAVAAAVPECAFHPAVDEAAGGLTIAQVADRTGVGAHTLRYYERVGLLAVPRDDAGHRVYGSAEVGRVVFISLLRAAAMPIRDLQAYFGLVADGPGNEAERIDVLERHRSHIAHTLTELTDALALVDLKLDLYRTTHEPRTP